MNKPITSLKKEILSANEITKFFIDGQTIINILDKINFKIMQGEMVAIIGPSGSGKSTLLHILCGLDKPSNGKIQLNGVNLFNLSDIERSFYRNKYLSFIYQFHYLLPEFSVLENVAIPLLLRNNVSVEEAESLAVDILKQLGLKDKINSFVYELSGGEKQRTAIARAIITKPMCVLADEPTGNLDHKNAMIIYDIIQELNKDFNIAFVIVTHDLKLAHKMQHVLQLENGKIMG